MVGMPLLEIFEMRGLWINQKSRGHGERRPLGGVGQPGDTEGTCDANRATEKARRKLG